MTRTQHSPRPAWIRALACSVAVVLALGAASCGGSEEGSNGEADASERAAGAAGTQSSKQTASSEQPAPGTPEYEIRSSYATFVDYLGAESPPATCDKLTRAFQRRLGGGWEGCMRQVAQIFASGRVTKGDREIVSIDVQDPGTATAEVKTAKGVQKLGLKFDGRTWRIDSGDPWR